MRAHGLRSRVAAMWTALLCIAFVTPSYAAPPHKVDGHVPNAVHHLTPLRPMAADQIMHLAIGLPLRNQNELEALLQSLYDPKNPQYHQYLTPQQFAQQFGPTQQDYDAVKKWAKANGLEVTDSHANRVVLNISGSAAAVEKALNVKLHIYQHPTDNRTFFAPDTDPSIDLDVPVQTIAGLEDFYGRKPLLRSKSSLTARQAKTAVKKISKETNGLLSPSATPQLSSTPADHSIDAIAPQATGSGPSGSYLGLDFRAAYVPGTTLNGSGQSVGSLQFDGFYQSDIAAYASQAGLHVPTITVVPIDGGVSTPGGGSSEVSLDIEMVIAMATNVSRIYVYEAPNPSPWIDLLSRIANDNICKQISCSWFGGGPDATAESIFMQMAAQGQTFFCASGDSDAFTGLDDVGFPTESPNITLVGGTTLTTTGPGGAWSSETVWNWGYGTGSTGGASPDYSLPTWQQGISMTANKGSISQRNIPDVALTADNVYVTWDNGGSGIFGGTSCAAPLWAGYTALINQQAATYGDPSIGFLNPLVYNIGKGSNNYTSVFHDITTGNNTSATSSNAYFAVSGYDLCTGWGTPSGTGLINMLALPVWLHVLPSNGFLASGPAGGPFAPASIAFTVTNAGATSFTWNTQNTNAWLTATPSSGTLSGHSSAQVTVSLNANASNLVSGIYNGSVTFTDSIDGIAVARSFTLTALGTPIVTNQPAAQTNVQGGTALFTVGAVGTAPLTYQWRFNGADISGATTTSLSLSSLMTTQSGSYSVVVSNSVGSTTSSNAALTVTASLSSCVDDFDTGINPSQWLSIQGLGVVNNAASTASGTNALVLRSNGSAITAPIDTSAGADIHFYLRIAESSFGQSIMPDDSVEFDYSINNGQSWLRIQLYDTEDFFLWQLVRPTLPANARSHQTLFRWKHLNTPSADSNFALDAVSITTSNMPAWISSQPLDQYVAPTKPATFSVQAEGTQPLAFQWFKNGTTINSATSSSYTIASVHAADYASYSVRITNAYGQVTSANVRLIQSTFTNKPSVLYVSGMNAFGFRTDGRADYGSGEDIRRKLEQTGLFSKVDLFLLSYSNTPSVALLQKYDAVLSTMGLNGDGFILIGSPTPKQIIAEQTQDAIATYLDGGGGAVVGITWFSSGWTWNQTDPRFYNYMPFTSAYYLDEIGAKGIYQNFFVTNAVNHPILDGISSFRAGLTVWLHEKGYYQDGTHDFNVVSNATLVGTWTGATAPESFVAALETNKMRVVGFNAEVETYDFDSYQFPTSGDFIHLLANSLLWSAQHATVAPSFPTAMTNQIIYFGSSTVLSNLAVGSGALQYQWLKNGLPISGATDNTLVITSAQGADTGTYSLVASNVLGSATNTASMWIINVPGAPTITQQPQNQRATLGGSVTFTVAATSALTYQWQKDNVDIPGATDSSYTRSNLDLTDVGRYAVMVSNDIGATRSSSAELGFVPSIVVQPQNTNVISGGFVSVSVVAAGSPTLHYQWYYNGGVYSGATNSSAGLYSVSGYGGDATLSVIVSSWSGSVTSRVAVISFCTQPAITTQPINTSAYPSNNAHFLIAATGNGLSYQWSKNGAVLPGATDSILAFPAAKATDAGTYYVVVTNVAGSTTSSNATLTINGQPIIIAQPQTVAVIPTSNAVFTVTATGSAPLSYQWRLNGGNISGETNTSYTRLNVLAADVGSYSVIITNPAGSVTSDDALLTLNSCEIHLLNVASNADGSVGLTYSTDIGGSYKLQYKTNLTDAQWITISTNIANSNTLTVTDTPSASQRFYRLSSSCAASEPGGFIQLKLLGNSDSFISLPLLRPPAAWGSVATISGNVVTCSLQYPATLTANQFVYAGATQSNNYCARFVSGSAQGSLYPVTANDASSLTLDTSTGSLASIATGDLFVVEPYWTLNSVFPNGAGVNSSPTLGNRYTEILVPDVTASGINLSASKLYFFNAGTWKQFGDSAVDHGDDVLQPNAHFVVRQNVATSTTLMVVGAADTSPRPIALRASDGTAGTKQDNYVGLARAAAISLDASGLVSSGAFASSLFPSTRTDELLVFDNNVVAKNKSASAVYYYWSNAWRRVGNGTNIVGGDVIFTPGTGAIIRKGTNIISPVWTNASPY